jgi:hypothetical protein
VGELVTLHVDDTPMLGATWLFDNGINVFIDRVPIWDDAHWHLQHRRCRLLFPI